IQFFDPSTLEPTGEALADDNRNDAITSLAFSPDGKVLASVDNEWHIKLWDVEKRERLLTNYPDFHRSDASNILVFRPDGKGIYSVDRGHETTVRRSRFL